MTEQQKLRQFITEVSGKYVGKKVVGAAGQGATDKSKKVASKYIKHARDPERAVPVVAGLGSAALGKEVGTRISTSKTAKKVADKKDKKVKDYLAKYREKEAEKLSKNENVVKQSKEFLASKPGRTATKALKRSALAGGTAAGSVAGYHITRATDDARKQKAALDAAIKAKRLEQQKENEKRKKK